MGVSLLKKGRWAEGENKPEAQTIEFGLFSLPRNVMMRILAFLSWYELCDLKATYQAMSVSSDLMDLQSRSDPELEQLKMFFSQYLIIQEIKGNNSDLFESTIQGFKQACNKEYQSLGPWSEVMPENQTLLMDDIITGISNRSKDYIYRCLQRDPRFLRYISERGLLDTKGNEEERPEEPLDLICGDWPDMKKTIGVLKNNGVSTCDIEMLQLLQCGEKLRVHLMAIKYAHEALLRLKSPWKVVSYFAQVMRNYNSFFQCRDVLKETPLDQGPAHTRAIEKLSGDIENLEPASRIDEYSDKTLKLIKEKLESLKEKPDDNLNKEIKDSLRKMMDCTITNPITEKNAQELLATNNVLIVGFSKKIQFMTPKCILIYLRALVEFCAKDCLEESSAHRAQEKLWEYWGQKLQLDCTHISMLGTDELLKKLSPYIIRCVFFGSLMNLSNLKETGDSSLPSELIKYIDLMEDLKKRFTCEHQIEMWGSLVIEEVFSAEDIQGTLLPLIKAQINSQNNPKSVSLEAFAPLIVSLARLGADLLGDMTSKVIESKGIGYEKIDFTPILLRYSKLCMDVVQPEVLLQPEVLKLNLSKVKDFVSHINSVLSIIRKYQSVRLEALNLRVIEQFHEASGYSGDDAMLFAGDMLGGLPCCGLMFFYLIKFNNFLEDIKQIKGLEESMKTKLYRFWDIIHAMLKTMTEDQSKHLELKTLYERVKKKSAVLKETAPRSAFTLFAQLIGKNQQRYQAIGLKC